MQVVEHHYSVIHAKNKIKRTAKHASKIKGMKKKEKFIVETKYTINIID